MKFVLLAALVAATPAAAFAAETATPAAKPATAAPAATAARLTVDTPIETIVADPAGKAVLDANLPGMTTHAAYDQFKAMSLKAVQPFSNGMITDELLTKVATALAAIK